MSYRSFKARPILDLADLCGCYYCLTTYSPANIEEWVDSGQTATCPNCGIDSVIPFQEELDKSPEIFKQKLQKYNKRSF